MTATTWIGTRAESRALSPPVRSLAFGGRVLVPVDLTGASLAALRSVCARVDGAADVRVLHVLEEPSSDAGYIRHAIERAPTPEAVQAQLEARLESMGLDRVSVTVAQGRPAAVIRDAARRLDCDLIAMSHRPRPWWARIFSRRTAERVLRRAPCAVLMLDPQPASASASRSRRP